MICVIHLCRYSNATINTDYSRPLVLTCAFTFVLSVMSIFVISADDFIE